MRSWAIICSVKAVNAHTWLLLRLLLVAVAALIFLRFAVEMLIT